MAIVVTTVLVGAIYRVKTTRVSLLFTPLKIICVGEITMISLGMAIVVTTVLVGAIYRVKTTRVSLLVTPLKIIRVGEITMISLGMAIVVTTVLVGAIYRVKTTRVSLLFTPLKIICVGEITMISLGMTIVVTTVLVSAIYRVRNTRVSLLFTPLKIICVGEITMISLGIAIVVTTVLVGAIYRVKTTRVCQTSIYTPDIYACLINHSSESIHIWTIVTLDGWYSHHYSRPQGPCPWMGLGHLKKYDKVLVKVSQVVYFSESINIWTIVILKTFCPQGPGSFPRVGLNINIFKKKCYSVFLTSTGF